MSIEDICDAQAETGMDSSDGYWTALKLNSTGQFQWGHLADNTANIADELLDTTHPWDRCYVINGSAMKLLSKDCDSLQQVLTSYTDPDDSHGKQRISSSHQKHIYHIGPWEA